MWTKPKTSPTTKTPAFIPSHLDMQPRKSCSAAASSACWLTCFPLAPGFAAFLSPCDRPPARMQRQHSWPLISCFTQTQIDVSQISPSSAQMSYQRETKELSTSIWVEGGYSYQYAVAVCASWLGARVCQPRWSGGLVTRARSIRSLVGSRRINKHTVKGRKRHYGIYSVDRLLNALASVFVMAKFSTPVCRKASAVLADVRDGLMNGEVKHDDTENTFGKRAAPAYVCITESWQKLIPESDRWQKKYLTSYNSWTSVLFDMGCAEMSWISQNKLRPLDLKRHCFYKQDPRDMTSDRSH